MYAYCENNPVNNSDPNGETLSTVLGGAVFGFVVGFGGDVIRQLVSGTPMSEFDCASALIEGARGALIGGLAGAGKVGHGARAIASTVIEVGTTVAHSINDGDDFVTTLGKAGKTLVTSGLTSGLKLYGSIMYSGKHVKLNDVQKFVKSICDGKICQTVEDAAQYVSKTGFARTAKRILFG